MELQFQKTPLTYLEKVVGERSSFELTQELKIPAGLPDIGVAICAGGQILIRGKQWDHSAVGGSGGVQVWVLYSPEDGTEPRVVEAWVPFEKEWNHPETAEDGRIIMIPSIRLIDARNTSQRKIMIKMVVEIECQAFVLEKKNICSPGNMPEDVQLLVREYSMLIPTEAGERSFTIDEELHVPTDLPTPEKMICCSLRPIIKECKVMAGKLVFRGSGLVQIVYQSEDGLNAMDMELPFAQYGELDQDYEPDATVSIIPVLTSFDLEQGTDNTWRIKTGILAQYIVSNRKSFRIAEDAYSTKNQLEANFESLNIPNVVRNDQRMMIASNSAVPDGKVISTWFYPDLPQLVGPVEDRKQQFSGRFQTLFYDIEGTLRCNVSKWDYSEHVEGDGIPTTDVSVENVSSENASLQINDYVLTNELKSAICDVNLGQSLLKDQNRPSLVIRRMGEGNIWELAKHTGSTVADIYRINALEDEPSPGTMLILPVS